MTPIKKSKQKHTSADSQRMIERGLPVTEITAINEAMQRNPARIANLHLWWARRPQIVARSVAAAALLPTISEDQFKQLVSIVPDPNVIKTLTQHINGKKQVKVLDPFAGGGSIGFEAARLGCEVYCSDYNPLAVFIQQCSTVYPFIYPDLPAKIKLWGERLLEKVKERLQPYYGTNDYAYLWLRQVNCPNPACRCRFPLLTSYWLANKPRRQIALYPIVNLENKTIDLQIVGTGYLPFPNGFDPKKGSYSNGMLICPACHTVVSRPETKRITQALNPEQLAIIITRKQNKYHYTIPTPADIARFTQAQTGLDDFIATLSDQWEMPAVPTDPIPYGSSGAERGICLTNYGVKTWGDLYNPRQQREILLYLEALRTLRSVIIEQEGQDYGSCIVQYLSLCLSTHLNYNNRACRWKESESIYDPFARHPVVIAPNYCESNPIYISNILGNYSTNLNRMIATLSALVSMPKMSPCHVAQASATDLPHPDATFDAIFADPPYYDHLAYSILADFFYVWLKRAVGDLLPDLFVTSTSPQRKEIVVYNFNGGVATYHQLFAQSIGEFARVLKPDGIITMTYTHNTLDGLFIIIDMLQTAGLCVTGLIPLRTEKQNQNMSNASTIYIVARKSQQITQGVIEDVLYSPIIKTTLTSLWRSGLHGLDFVLVAIGKILAIIGQYRTLLHRDGTPVTPSDLRKLMWIELYHYISDKLLPVHIVSQITETDLFYFGWLWMFGSTEVMVADATTLAAMIGCSSVRSLPYIRKTRLNHVALIDLSTANYTPSSPNGIISTLQIIVWAWYKKRYSTRSDLYRAYGITDPTLYHTLAAAILPHIQASEQTWYTAFLSDP